MPNQLGPVDTAILIIYALVLIIMGVYYLRKNKTSNQFMVAGRTIPAWAAGLAIMSAATSSISYIAVPGKAFDTDWHPIIFVLVIIPVTWFVTKYVIPHYRKRNIISVYKFLEEKTGNWSRIYASFSFLLFMVGRTSVILYLSSILLTRFIDADIEYVIITIGIITIIYTLMGGMEAVIWTDVIQSAIMIIGIIFCSIMLSIEVFSKPEFLIQNAFNADKFSLGDTSFSLYSRTIWVMIIYGVTENVISLMADQNYTQKYCSVPTEREAKKSVWIGMLIYIPLTAVFLYIGTTLFAFYSGPANTLGDAVAKGDEVFPYYIATQLPVGLRGLIISAIIAASMSTIDSALNCSATVLFTDFYKRYFNRESSEKSNITFLRLATITWGALGMFFALLLINAESALDTWWQISGIFGGGILGLFLVSIFNIQITKTQGILSVLFSVIIIIWGTFARELPPDYAWLECKIEPIIIGATGTTGMVIAAVLFSSFNKLKPAIQTKLVR